MASQSVDECLHLGDGTGVDRLSDTETGLRRLSDTDQRVSVRKLGKQSEIRGTHLRGEPGVIVYGDSRVRFMDRAFCERNRDKRMRVCLPGAKLKDLLDRFDGVLKGSSPNSVLILHGGVSDVGNTLSEELIDTYRMVITSLAKSGRKGIITGICPKLVLEQNGHRGPLELIKELRGFVREAAYGSWTTGMLFGVKESYTRLMVII